MTIKRLALSLCMLLSLAVAWAQPPLPNDFVNFGRRDFSDVFMAKPRFYWGERVRVSITGMIEGNNEYWVTEECDFWVFGCEDVPHSRTNFRPQSEVPLLLRLSAVTGSHVPPGRPVAPVSAAFTAAADSYWVPTATAPNQSTFEFEVGADGAAAAQYSVGDDADMLRGYFLHGRISDRIGSGGGALVANGCAGMRTGHCSGGQLAIRVESVDVSARVNGMKAYLSQRRAPAQLTTDDFIDPFLARDAAARLSAVHLLLKHANDFYPLAGDEQQKKGRFDLLNRMVLLEPKDVQVLTALVDYHIDNGDFLDASAELNKLFEETRQRFDQLNSQFQRDKIKRPELAATAADYGRALIRGAEIASKRRASFTEVDVRSALADYQHASSVFQVALANRVGGRDAVVEQELGQAAVNTARLFALLRTIPDLQRATESLDQARLLFPRTRNGELASVDGSRQRVLLTQDVGFPASGPLRVVQEPLSVYAQAIMGATADGSTLLLKSGNGYRTWTDSGGASRFSLPSGFPRDWSPTLVTRRGAVVMKRDGEVVFLSGATPLELARPVEAGWRRQLVVDDISNAVLEIVRNDAQLRLRRLLVEDVVPGSPVPWTDVSVPANVPVGANIVAYVRRVADGATSEVIVVQTDSATALFDLASGALRCSADVTGKVAIDGLSGAAALLLGAKTASVIGLSDCRVMAKTVALASLDDPPASRPLRAHARTVGSGWILYPETGPTRRFHWARILPDGSVEIKVIDCGAWVSLDTGAWKEIANPNGGLDTVLIRVLDSPRQVFAIDALAGDQPRVEHRPDSASLADPKNRYYSPATRLMFGGDRVALYQQSSRSLRFWRAGNLDQAVVTAAKADTVRLMGLESTPGSAFVVGVDSDNRVTELVGVAFARNAVDAVAPVNLPSAATLTGNQNDAWTVSPSVLQYAEARRLVLTPASAAAASNAARQMPVLRFTQGAVVTQSTVALASGVALREAILGAGDVIVAIVDDRGALKLQAGNGSVLHTWQAAEFQQKLPLRVAVNQEGNRLVLSQLRSSPSMLRVSGVELPASGPARRLVCQSCDVDIAVDGVAPVDSTADAAWVAVGTPSCTLIDRIVPSDAPETERWGAPRGVELRLSQPSPAAKAASPLVWVKAEAGRSETEIWLAGSGTFERFCRQ